MSSFKDLLDEKSLNGLWSIKESEDEKVAKLRAEELKNLEEIHKKHHIFNTYEEALDWLISNDGECIEWHTKTLSYDKTKDMLISNEQEFDIDGIIPYNVTRYYRRDELLCEIKSSVDYLKKKYCDFEYEKDFLDEYGKLKYVYKH